MAGCWEIHQAMLPGGSGVGSPHSAFQRCLLVRFADTFRWGFLFQWRQSTSRQVYEENLRWRCPCLQTREFSRPSWALRGSRFPYVSIWHWLVVWNMSFFSTKNEIILSIDFHFKVVKTTNQNILGCSFVVPYWIYFVCWCSPCWPLLTLAMYCDLIRYKRIQPAVKIIWGPLGHR